MTVQVPWLIVSESLEVFEVENLLLPLTSWTEISVVVTSATYSEKKVKIVNQNTIQFSNHVLN